MLNQRAVRWARAVRRVDRSVWMVTGVCVALVMNSAMVFAQQGGRPPVPPTPPATVVPPVPAKAPEPLAFTLRDGLAPFDAVYGERYRDMEFRAAELAMRAQSIYRADAMRASVQSAMAASAPYAVESAFAASQLATTMARASLDAVAPVIWNVTSQFNDALSSSFYGAGVYASSVRAQAPASWDADDPADSLYREARKALSNDSYRRAAELFRRIRDQYPKSTYTPDAPYWEAFALQRIGATSDLRAAMEVLAYQQDKFPRAATRGDATSLRTRIEGQLARNGDQQAVQSLTRLAESQTSNACPRSRDDERVDALNAVAQIDAEKAMPILRKVLTRREPCTEELRKTAVWLIASKKQPEAASILLNVAKSDPDKGVREQAVFWMANVPTEEATTMLIDLAKRSDDLELQKRAVYSLSRSKSPRAATTLREISLDPNADVEVRRTALSYYMSGPGKTMDNPMTFLKEVYGKADSREFKSMALDIIGRQKTSEARAFLVDVAQNAKESTEARRSAIYALRTADITAAELGQIYDRGSDVEVRKQIISLLGSLRENAGADKLLDIARNEKDVELRKMSLTYLTRSKDPRAILLLQEIINR